MTRLFALIAAALLLTACDNYVISDNPVVTASVAVPEPAWKNGIWTLQEADKPCTFDPAKSVTEWPECAQPLLIKDETFFKMLMDVAKASGEPIPPEVGFQAMLAQPNLWVVQFSMGDAKQTMQFFLTLDRTSVDAQGKATTFLFGALQCGPPELAPDGKGKALTKSPFPGAIIVGSFCRPDGVEGLKSLAASNRNLEVQTAKWVRAARPDEVEFLEAQMQTNSTKLSQ